MKQYYINYFDVMEKLNKEDIEKFKNDVSKGFVHQVDNCQAWIISGEYFEILQSYNTLVACIDNTGKIYCSGYYSNTTAQQIGRFAKRYGLTYQDFKKVM